MTIIKKLQIGLADVLAIMFNGNRRECFNLSLSELKDFLKIEYLFSLRVAKRGFQSWKFQKSIHQPVGLRWEEEVSCRKIL